MPYVNNNKNGGSDEGEHDDIKAKEELLAALQGEGDGDKTNDKVGYDDADDGEGVEMEQLTIHASSSSTEREVISPSSPNAIPSKALPSSVFVRAVKEPPN